MDPQDRLARQLSGAGCTVCGATVPAGGIVLLADRGDLAFVEVRCATCGSQTLGLVLAGPPGSQEVCLVDGPPSPELGPGDAARIAGRPPVQAADVVRMRRFLAAWHGDLRSLLEDGDGRGGTGPA